MHATLIYNGNAGGAGRVSAQDMERALQRAGYTPVYKATSSEHDLDAALADTPGLVVAAGGDGTVRAVALRLVGRGVPLTILPMGTANNIARSLGLSGAPLDLIAAMGTPQKRAFDVGKLSAPWGSEYFLEAAGCGIYAEVLAAYDPHEGKSVARALSALGSAISTYTPLELELSLDGRKISGSFVIAEALNTSAVGPRLQLAPRADSGDGLLDVVLIDGEQRDSALAYLRCLLTGELDRLSSVRIERCHRLELSWSGEAFHVDGEVRPPAAPVEAPRAGDRERCLAIEVLPGALELFVPAEVTA